MNADHDANEIHDTYVGQDGCETHTKNADHQLYEIQQ